MRLHQYRREYYQETFAAKDEYLFHSLLILFFIILPLLKQEQTAADQHVTQQCFYSPIRRRGETCSASVKFPKHLHGCFHPSDQRPTLYAATFVAKHRTKPKLKCFFVEKKQTAAISNSRMPVKSIR